MGNDYSANIPIYLQIMNEIKLKIVSGEWETDQRLTPVRELAMQFSVNPNTMQRALSELEREGLLYTERTSGRFVTSDENLVSKIRDEMAEEYTMNFIKNMLKLGYNTQRILKIVENYTNRNMEVNKKHY